jgi:hypothetical protein
MMASAGLRLFSPGAVVFLVLAVLGGLLIVWLFGFWGPHNVREFSAEHNYLIFVASAYVVLAVVALIRSVSLLLKGNKLAASYHFAVVCIAGVFLSWLGATSRDDNFSYRSSPHREIAEIYQWRKAEEFDPSTARVVNTSPRVVDLEEQCHPARWCQCWIVLDPLHRSDFERQLRTGDPLKATFPSDRGEPVTLLAPEITRGVVGTVSVRRIDAIAYSMLTCPGVP